MQDVGGHCNRGLDQQPKIASLHNNNSYLGIRLQEMPPALCGQVTHVSQWMLFYYFLGILINLVMNVQNK